MDPKVLALSEQTCFLKVQQTVIVLITLMTFSTALMFNVVQSCYIVYTYPPLLKVFVTK